MKEYKSNVELLNHLLSKGVKVKNKRKALSIFEKYTYYSVVNTYKEVFKISDKYIDGVTFEEIFALYEFDKNLKVIFLKYALEIEIVIKSLMANTISKRYGLEKYLDYSCFADSIATTLIDDLKMRINKEVSKNYKKHPAITHYKDKYGFIPPFVIVKILTLGEISRYYGLLKQEDRQAISRYFNISDKLLKQILKNLTIVGNACAHNGRLYTYRSKFFISYQKIDKAYKKKDDLVNLYILINCMGRLLDEKNYKKFVKQVNSEISKLSRRISSINIKKILNIMGFQYE